MRANSACQRKKENSNVYAAAGFQYYQLINRIPYYFSDKGTEMAFTHQSVERMEIIRLEESVDMYSVFDLKKYCLELLKGGTKKFIFCMEKLDYMDSSGVGFLFLFITECRKNNAEAVIAGISDQMKKLFELTKMNDKLPFAESVKDAVIKFSGV